MWCHCIFADEVQQIAKWLACVYRSMDDFQDNSNLLKTLQTMRVIPLSTGDLVSLDQVTVFLLSESGQSEKQPVVSRQGKCKMCCISSLLKCHVLSISRPHALA